MPEILAETTPWPEEELATTVALIAGLHPGKTPAEIRQFALTYLEASKRYKAALAKPH
ncbi:hypothetical protein KW785_01085 [Candidatus Parcubacteria bacterium]|nr:hypothetical protein [Candidatus Parcubacteria bacterium]